MAVVQQTERMVGSLDTSFFSVRTKRDSKSESLYGLWSQERDRDIHFEAER